MLRHVPEHVWIFLLHAIHMTHNDVKYNKQSHNLIFTAYIWEYEIWYEDRVHAVYEIFFVQSEIAQKVDEVKTCGYVSPINLTAITQTYK